MTGRLSLDYDNIAWLEQGIVALSEKVAGVDFVGLARAQDGDRVRIGKAGVLRCHDCPGKCHFFVPRHGSILDLAANPYHGFLLDGRRDDLSCFGYAAG